MCASAPAGLVPALAALRAADGVALVVLVAFTWWGTRKGALRQALSLFVLAAAFLTGSRLGKAFEPTVARLFDLDAAERLAVAWAAAVLGALLAGAILLRLLAHSLPARSRGGVDRVLGGLLGAAKGAVVLTIAGYALLAAAPGGPGPSLSRPTAPTSTTTGTSGLDDRVRGSLSAVCLEEWSGLLRRWIDVPAWVALRIDTVNRRIQAPVPDEGGGARPRGR